MFNPFWFHWSHVGSILNPFSFRSSPNIQKNKPHKGRWPSATSTKGGRRLRRRPPFVDSFMDGCVVAGGAADVAKTRKSGEK